MRETQRDAARSAAAASIAMLGSQRWCRPPFAFVIQRIDWQRAGFRKVQTTSGRGDEQAPVPSVGIFRGLTSPSATAVDRRSNRRTVYETSSRRRIWWLTNQLATNNSSGRENEMNRVLSAAAASVTIVAAVACATAVTGQSKNEIAALTPDEVRWFTPPFYNDGRQRAQLFGDSSQGGAWIDRVKIPGGARVLAHTHAQDELVTVIEGTWYLGEGVKFEAAKLRGYPTGSFIVIPAGVPHFVAADGGTVVVQISGTGKFQTEYLEKPGRGGDVSRPADTPAPR